MLPILHLGKIQPKHLRELPPEPIPLLHDPDAHSAPQQLTLDHFAEWIASKQRAHHCPVCNLWLTKPRWMRVHLQQQHAEYKAHLPTIDKRLKALGSSARQCGWCDTRHDRGRAACRNLPCCCIGTFCVPWNKSLKLKALAPPGSSFWTSCPSQNHSKFALVALEALSFLQVLASASLRRR